MQQVLALALEDRDDYTILEALRNTFKLADRIVDIAEPDPEDWTTKLQVLWRDIMSSTSTIFLEPADGKLNFLDADLRFKDVVTVTE